MTAALLSACLSPAKPAGEDSLSEAGGAVINFINHTPFPVHIVRGSGRIDICDVAPYGNTLAPNSAGSDESYYPVFDVPLTGDYYLKNLYSEDRDFYYSIDSRVLKQEINIHLPEAFSDTAVYIVFTNASKTGGVYLSRNERLDRMTAINWPGARSNINSGETAVFRIGNAKDLTGFTVRPLNISSGLSCRPGFVYSLVFDGSSITLNDSRPLNRMGETGWTKTLEAAGLPVLAAGNGGNISVFAPGPEGIWHFETGPGESGQNRTLCAEKGSVVTSALPLEDGAVLASGYVETARGEYSPLLWKQNEGGATALDFPAGYRYGTILSLAAKEGPAFLAAGSADDYGGGRDYGACLNLLQDEGGRLVKRWEIGPKDLGDKFGEARSAVWVPIDNIWRVTGVLLDYDSRGNLLPGSYVIEVDDAGGILKTDVSFNGLSFYKILAARDGSWYLAGEEAQGRALLVKYDRTGKLLWRQQNRLQAFSYYQDAMLVEEDSQIVLAGTMNAADGGGTGGTPFLQGINAATGAEEWRAEPGGEFPGTALAYSLVRGKGYGYVTALCGVAEGMPSGPYIIARLNERGLMYGGNK
ncbi:MAG: hypothetical protein LBG26_01770 [Treponema sp.]|nr:hypothetical protein [Treponema sp.]